MKANLTRSSRAEDDPALTAEGLREALHYAPDTGAFTWRVRTGPRAKIGGRAGGMSDGYRRITLRGIAYGAHILAWLYTHGVWPSGMIDHVNRIRSDNRIDNLREATPRENATNRSKNRNNTSGYRGVVWHGATQRWAAQICHNWRSRHLGVFDTKKEASAAYEAAAIELFRDFKPKNL